MRQQEIMQAWHDWMVGEGLSAEQADLFIKRGPAWCEYLMRAAQ